MNDAEFVLPDWNEPLDLAAYLAVIPEGTTIKGMFFQTPIRIAREHSGRAIGRDYYTAFKDYPFGEYLETVGQCAELAYPEQSTRQAFRLIARNAYPTFFNTTIGRVLFKFAGNNFGAALKVVPKAYRLVSKRSHAEILEQGERYAIFAIRNLWDIPYVSQVGVFEGGLESFGLQGEVRVRKLALNDVDINIAWS